MFIVEAARAGLFTSQPLSPRVQAVIATRLTQLGEPAFVAAAFAGYLAVLDGDVEAGLTAVEAGLRRAAEAPVAPGQHAMMQRLQLAALLAAGDREGAGAAAERLLSVGGPARLWAPLARRVRAELAGR